MSQIFAYRCNFPDKKVVSSRHLPFAIGTVADRKSISVKLLTEKLIVKKMMTLQI